MLLVYHLSWHYASFLPTILIFFLQKQPKILVLKAFFYIIFFIKQCNFIGLSNNSNHNIDKKKLNNLSFQSFFHFRLSLL